MNTLRLNIVTPNGSVYEREDVEMAVLQTTCLLYKQQLVKWGLCMVTFQLLLH